MDEEEENQQDIDFYGLSSQFSQDDHDFGEEHEQEGAGPEESQTQTIHKKKIVGTVFNKVQKRQDYFEDYRLVRRLAKSGCGAVYLVLHKTKKQFFAMKSIRKDFIIKNEMIDCLVNEKTIMQEADHPFILKLISYFQLPLRIYFLMDFFPGGDLKTHQRRYNRFSEDVVRFFAAQIALALVHLHSKGIVYRDLKPENILVQEDGYLMLADFGIAARLREGELSQSFCGTYDYMAPEMLKKDSEGHSFPLDWWSFGILVYELLIGICPFYNHNHHATMKQILSRRHAWPPEKEFQSVYNFSSVTKDFVDKLLVKDPKLRLGSENSEDVLQHPFFKNFIDFEALKNKKVQPPWEPVIPNPEVQAYHEVVESVIDPKIQELIRKSQKQFEVLDFGKY
ncbi:hypothetical protein FGO68_gene12794 [Halteria grandinella]|uniref:Protein kinase domain-containing protein n=1 Tax=Halteria grandinella TaxID=5974 RepID=A0A8J8P0F9_HALGN|nr:hypothetical protein FGO68_gene12794 [Halteria grandinella]